MTVRSMPPKVAKCLTACSHGQKGFGSERRNPHHARTITPQHGGLAISPMRDDQVGLPARTKRSAKLPQTAVERDRLRIFANDLSW